MMTRIVYATLATAMAFVTNAIPIEERQIDARFAGFPNILTHTAPSLGSIASVGVSQGLNYTGISLAMQRISAFAGLALQTPGTDLFYSTISSLVPSGGPPKITIPATSVGLITPKSFSFGCNAGMPAACTLTVTGSRKNVQTAQQTFQFTPMGYPSALQQAVLTLAGFNGVDKLEFSSSYSVFGIPIPGSTVLESLSYGVTAS